MSTLDLTIEDLGKHPFIDNTFHLLSKWLQSDTKQNVQSVATSILDSLPDEAPNCEQVRLFGDLCIEVAEQIPYHHASQLKLVSLFEELGWSPKFGAVDSRTTFGESDSKPQYIRFQALHSSLMDNHNDPNEDNPSVYINFSAFAAKLYERRIIDTDPTWAIWAQREALEGWNGGTDTVLRYQGAERDAYVMGAAQWILWYGQSVLMQILTPRKPEDDEQRSWRPGPLYNGSSYLSLERWQFWRDAYKMIASGEETLGEEDPAKSDQKYSEECVGVASRVAELMESLEKALVF